MIYIHIVLYVLDSDSIQLNQMLLPKHHYRVGCPQLLANKVVQNSGEGDWWWWWCPKKALQFSTIKGDFWAYTSCSACREREWMREGKLWKFSFCLTFRHCLVINKKCTRLLFVFAISWCLLLQCLGDPAGWPRWPCHLPAMTESLCFRCLHVSLPMTWPAMRPILILKILLVFMRNVSAYYLLRLY